MKHKIWTYYYNAFVMGGDVWRPMGTEVEVLEARNIGGVDVFSFALPTGGIRIAELTTGGIVGQSFEDVTKDIEESDLEVLQQQLLKQKEIGDRAEMVSNDTFFARYAKAK